MENDMTGTTAWMIKNDGTEIPVSTHIYANKDETDELLALAYYLWINDNDSRSIISKFLDIWAYHTFVNEAEIWAFKEIKTTAQYFAVEFVFGNDVIYTVNEYISAKPYRIFTDDWAKLDFARIVAGQSTLLKAAFLKNQGERESVETEPLDGMDLVDILNQRFLRARYGGRYGTVPGCQDMYFRISSVGFDWFPIIHNFVEKKADLIKTVTVVRDFESTGCEKYYVDVEYRSYNKMPVSDFLASSGSTNYLSKNKADRHFNVHEILAKGGSVQQLRLLHMNYGRVRRRIEILKHKEESQLVNE